MKSKTGSLHQGIKSPHIIIGGIIIGLIMIFFLILPIAGNYLIIKEKKQKSKGILILMGSLPERVLETYDIVKEGFADTIYIVQTHQMAIKTLYEKGITLPGQAELSKLALIQLGISSEHIVIIPRYARSTLDEANAFAQFLVDKPNIDTVLLVTSPEHTRRTTLIFKKALSSINHPVKIIICPSRYSEFNAEEWWKCKEDIEIVLKEYGKLLYGFFYEY